MKNGHKVFVTVSLFVNASDVLLSMLFNLRLASITILLCFFFLFVIVYKKVFTNPVVIENARLQFALMIPTNAPIAVPNDTIEILPVATDKTINDLSKYSKEEIYLLLQEWNRILFFLLYLNLL